MAKKNKKMRIHPSFPEQGNEQPAHMGSQSAMPMPSAPGEELNNPGQAPDPANVLGSQGY